MNFCSEQSQQSRHDVLQWEQVCESLKRQELNDAFQKIFSEEGLEEQADKN